MLYVVNHALRECHAGCLIPNPSQKIHKSHASLHSQFVRNCKIFTLPLSWLEMLLCSLRQSYFLPRTFSKMFTKFISTCLLPRTFTNVHKVYFHMSLAQNIHKCSQSLFPHVCCPEHSEGEQCHWSIVNKTRAMLVEHCIQKGGAMPGEHCLQKHRTMLVEHC